MMSIPEQYYCGGCNRFQLASDGERCKHCGRITISALKGESVEDMKKRWKARNGIRT